MQQEHKAGSAYLAEAKLWHLEEGFEWNSVLDRMMTMCKRALDRSRGPRKKAPEVPEGVGTPAESSSDREVRQRDLLFAMVWLMREIELAAQFRL